MYDIRHQFSVSDTVTTQLICNDPPRFAAVHSDQPLAESLSCTAVPARLQKYIDHLTILVNSPLQIVLFARNLHEYFIYIESVPITSALGQQILNISMTQIKRG
jgi:hypothetical protein